MLQRIRDGFFQVGWLLPTLVPASVTLGRALANTLFFLYFLWALLALRPRDFRLQAKWLWLYVVMVAAFLLSVLEAVQPGEALHTWFRWGTYTLALPITFAVLARQALDDRRMLTWFGVSALIAMTAFLFILLVDIWEGAQVASAINGMSMAYLMPFLVFWLIEVSPKGTARWRVPFVVCVALAGLLLADSSTELLVVGAGLLVLTAFMSRFGVRVLWLIVVLVPTVLLIELLPKWQTLQASGFKELLSVWSSKRTDIWIGAFQVPPENPWLGVGMGNAQYYEPVLRFKLKGFHNFLLDAWYETGVLGLCALLALLGYLGGVVVLRLRTASAALRRRSAPWIASLVAILVAASLDHSYGSVSFALIMMFELAVLQLMLAPRRADAAVLSAA